MDAQKLKKYPSLFIFLPLIHVIWADAVLTPTELENINYLIENQTWLTTTEKRIIKEYINPKNPPTPAEMKEWLLEIKQVSESLSPTLKEGLIEIGIKLSQLNGNSATEDQQRQVRESLAELEAALGVVNSEAKQNLSLQSKTQGPDPSSFSPSFDVKSMANLLDGSHKELIQKVKTILCDSKFDYCSTQDMAQYREKVLQWCKHLSEQGFGAMAYPKQFGGSHDMGSYFTIMETLSYHDLSLVVKFGVQFGLFGMSVYFLGTKKHHEKYLNDIGSLKLPGAFAMTETGHGSNVRGIETTATYDHQNKSFVIHTPNEQARKDYIGNAACHGHMATVFAKMIIGGTDYGVSAFLVPLRNRNGKTLPGIRIEDCGSKMGLNGVDNGRIWFTNVKIPKENLLDQFASVNDQGEFESPIANDGRRFFTMLGTLVGGRIGIPRAALSAAKSGLAIAIKYGDSRRQFGPENAEEVSILDYRSHQRRLMPLLANTYALHFSLQYLTNRFLNRSEADMQEIEAMAAGMKAFATWNTTSTLQTCREACGGKGFLLENRLGTLKNDTDIFTTFEGDNTVLLQLVAKSRLTDFKKEFHDINFFGLVNYITKQAKTALVEMNPLTIRNTDENHLLDPEFQLAAFRFRERDILTSAAKRLKKHLDGGMSSFDAFNQCQVHLLNVGLAHVERLILEQFINQVNQTEDKDLGTVLKKLCDLFALSQIEKNKGWYLEHGYMDGIKTKAIRRNVNKLCLEIRKDAIGLVDAFGIPDKLLYAPIAFGRI